MDGFDSASVETQYPLPYPKEIAAAIAKVMGADLYVQKRGKNQFHGYKYATVGDLLDKLQPLMAEAGLVIFQHEIGSDLIDGGNVLATRYQFTLAHTSGAVWPEKPVHTGMTTCRNSKGGFDDKAANKCHTAARKYFLLGLFQVPTGEDFREAVHDGDADSGPDAPPPNGNGHSGAKPPRTAAPKGPDDPETQEARRLAGEIDTEIKAAQSLQELNALVEARGPALAKIKAVSQSAYEGLMRKVQIKQDAMVGVV